MRNVIITGGSRGIGRECVKRFAALGDRVIFTYLKSESNALELAAETGAIPVRGGDINLLKRTAEKFGAVDVLINNAGIAQQKLLCDITDEDWDNMFSVNIRDMFLTVRAFYGDFVHNKSGKIVNISSMWGITGASCEVHYSASKAAVIGFTRALAKELGPSGVNVNCIAPGVIDTDMNAHLAAEEKEELAAETPLGRLGTPAEVAAAAEFLCSDGANFITGQVLTCDGGFIGI